MTVSSKDRELVFEQTTDPEVIKFTHLQNGSAWRGDLTLEEYSEREWLLGMSELGQKNKSPEMKAKFPQGHQWLGIKYFVLKNLNLDSSSKTSQIVSSCEIMNRLGYCISPDTNNKMEPCLVGTVGGVYTMSEHRGKGYARKMVEFLNGYQDDISNGPDAPKVVGTLYSEVGEYYAKSGYKSSHVPVHIITQLDELEKQYCHETVAGRYLGLDGYQDLVALQQKGFEANLKKLHKENPGKLVFTIYPDIDIYKWFAYRDLFIMEKANRIQDNLKFGFALEDGSHLLWHHHWTENCLWIVKVFIREEVDNSEAVLKKLMTKAVEEAKKTGLKTLLFWDQEIVIQKFPKLQKLMIDMEHESSIYAENGSLSAYRPPKGFTADQIIWDNNTKFCWF